MGRLVAFLTGLVFGLGLLVSGMTDPMKVKAFLDLAGAWDPSLLLVMGAALGVTTLGYAWARRRGSAWSGAPIDLPAGGRVDLRLIAGAALFGIGWGLAGFCPGPSLVALGLGGEAGRAALVFVPAMLAGWCCMTGGATAGALDAAHAAPHHVRFGSAWEAHMSWLNYNPVVHWPLSGAVTQDIHPSLLAKAGDDETEVRVLREVASYGKQLGVLSDLLLALASGPNAKALGPDGEHALEQLRRMVEDIRRIKQEQHPLPESPEAGRALIAAVKKRFPELKST
jgi:uncharacterized protein